VNVKTGLDATPGAADRHKWNFINRVRSGISGFTPSNQKHIIQQRAVPLFNGAENVDERCKSLHETPVDVAKDIIKEAFRILKPGGDIVINDLPPFAGVHPFQAVILDWETNNRGEPYFSDTCSIEWSEVLADTGFIDIQSHNLGPQGYPWVDVATKPK